MKTSVYLIIILIITSISSTARSQFIEQWVQSYNGTGNYHDAASSIVIDDSKNIYITGYSYGSGTLNDYATIKYNPNGIQQWVSRYNGPGNGNDIVSSLAIFNSDIYVTGQSLGSGTNYDYGTVKYNSLGVQQWAARYNGTSNSNDGASAITVDGSGNVYVTGQSYGGTVSSYDFATVKYNSSGTELWSVRYNGPGNGNDGANAITVDQFQNVYITGSSVGSGTNLDYTTIKYNSSGNQLWVARYNGPANDIDVAKSIHVNGSGQVVITGYSRGSGTALDYSTIKYDTDGNQLWVTRYNGIANGSDIPSAMTVSSSDKIFITGVTNSDVSGLLANYGTICYSSSGDVQWIATYNGTGNSNDSATSVSLDDSGNVFVTGKSMGTGTSFDFATIKYSPAGSPQYVARFNSADNSKDVSNAVVIDNFGNTYVTGSSTLGSTTDDYLTIKYSKISGINILSSQVPEGYMLLQNYPNPFNPETIINYSLTSREITRISIYDILGNNVDELVNEIQNPGTYSVKWNASNFPSGIYYYTIESGKFTDTKKMILIK